MTQQQSEPPKIEASEVETLVIPDSGEAQITDAGADTDWKAMAESNAATIEKLQNDLKAARTGVMKQTERDDLLRDIADRLVASEKAQTAIVKGLATGVTDDLPDTLESIQSESRQRRQFQTYVNNLVDSMNEAVLGEDGNPLLDLDTSPELASAAAQWAQAGEKGDLGTMQAVVQEVWRITRQVERKNKAAADRELRRKLEEERKQAMEESGLLGTASSGSATARGKPSFAELRQRDKNRMTPAQLREHEQLVRDAIQEGRL